jgi:hypothetical protein
MTGLRDYGTTDYRTIAKNRNWESRKQVRSEKACVTRGESPPSLAARLPEFRMKVMNGKV